MTKALLIVDVQNDFCEGGTLAVAGGAAVAEHIRTYVDDYGDDYDLVVASQDWHEPHDIDPTGNCGHFTVPDLVSGVRPQPDYVNTWPVHCVQDTHGAQFRWAIEGVVDLIVRKGQGVPAYSAFEGSVAANWRKSDSGHHFIGANLGSVMRALGVSHVDVCGLAFDYCVKASAVDAAGLGLSVSVLMDLTAAVSESGAAQTRRDLAHFRYGIELVGESVTA